MSDRVFTPDAWFWIVAADETRFWSSAIGAYVAELPDGSPVTRILNEEELTDVLKQYGLPGPIVPALTVIPKNLIWSRATNEEAELMENALQSQPVRLRRIYEGATFISTEDELYGVLRSALEALFGSERAGELLQPTN